MIKLIATDMDGTLLNEAGQLPDGFIDLLNRLLQKNICFVIASGRSYYDLKDFFKEATPYLDFICDNGAFVVSRHHQRQMSLLEKKRLMTSCCNVNPLPISRLFYLVQMECMQHHAKTNLKR